MTQAEFTSAEWALKFEPLSGSQSFIPRAPCESLDNLIFVDKAFHLFIGPRLVGSAESLCLDCE